MMTGRRNLMTVTTILLYFVLDILNHLSTILSIYEYFIHSMDVIFAHVASTLEYILTLYRVDLVCLQSETRESGIHLGLTSVLVWGVARNLKTILSTQCSWVSFQRLILKEGKLKIQMLPRLRKIFNAWMNVNDASRLRLGCADRLFSTARGRPELGWPIMTRNPWIQTMLQLGMALCKLLRDGDDKELLVV